MNQEQREDMDQLMDNQIANCSEFLQRVSRIMGGPVVIGSTLTISEEDHPESVNLREQSDLAGITFATVCSSEMAQELIKAFDEIVEQYQPKD